MSRRLCLAVCLTVVAGCTCLLVRGGDAGGASAATGVASVARGRALYVRSCSSCHGFHATGRRGIAPSLIGVGALAADFELSTGRMPLPESGAEPLRGPPAFGHTDQRALVAYIATLGGPGIPAVHLAGARLAAGRTAFLHACAGCHTIGGQGGVIPGAEAPSLADATPTQIAEAVRLGPYLMPRFGPRQVSARALDSIAAYVVSTRHPNDAGGWAIGHIGPVPEGMVAWLIGLGALLVVARSIGERTP